MFRYLFLTLSYFIIFSVQADTLKVKIKPGVDYVPIQYHGKTINIMRIQDQEHTLKGGYAKTSRPCPPFCFQPIKVAEGVTTIGEIELLEFIKTKQQKGKGLLIDARLSSWYKQGTIPGSVNYPFTIFTPKLGDTKAEQLMVQTLAKLGVTKKQKKDSFFASLFSDNKNTKWDFSHAKELALFCNGPWCGQSPTAIRGLLGLGYPPEKLFYYRGGMQLWQLGGFTTVIPKD